MGVAVGVVAIVVVVAVYLSWTAGRIDRLHARVDAAAATLDAQLIRRAASAAALAASGALPGPTGERLAAAAAGARAAEGLGPDRELAENALARALHGAAALAPDVFGDGGLADDLRTASTKVGFARQFHNDAVRDTLTLRRRRIPRLARLAGHAPTPAYFEIDDRPLTVAEVAVDRGYGRAS